MKTNTEFSLPIELRDAVASVTTSLDRRKVIDNAIQFNAEQRSNALAAIAELEAAVPDLDAQLGVATATAALDPTQKSELAKLQKTADKAASTLDEKRNEEKRCSAAAPALYAEAIKADEAIQAAKLFLANEEKMFRESILPFIAAQVRDAARSVATVFATARALDAALPGRFYTDVFSLMKLIDPETASLVFTQEGIAIQGDSLLGENSTDTSAETEAIRISLADLTAAGKRVRQHQPFQMPGSSAIEEELRRHRNRQAAQGKADESDADQWKPPASTWKPGVINRPLPSRAVDLNVGAAIVEAG